MRLSLLIEYSGDPQRWLRIVPDLEHAGLDGVWIPEAYSFDAISLAGAMAYATTSVTIGTGIVNVYSRTPALLAMTAASLDQLSGGRFVLGLGASGPQVIEGFHGVPYTQPVERIRDTIEICRRVWAREAPLEYRGKALTVPLPPDRGTGQGKPLKLVNHPLRPRIPILWASMGPRAVALTAELADSWMPMFYWPEHAAETFGSFLADGAARRSPDLAPLDVVAGGIVAIDDPAAIAQAEAVARGMLALYVGGMGSRSTNFYHELLTRYGYGGEADRIQELYLSGAKAEATALVPADVVHGINLIGSREHVRERIAAYRAAGVTTLMAAGLVGDPVAAVRTLRGLIDE
jgi:F420-dependent oxidoreductase-like protein